MPKGSDFIGPHLPYTLDPTPLLSFARATAGDPPYSHNGGRKTDKWVCDYWSISHRQWMRWQHEGQWITWRTADRICIETFGCHPAWVFGDAWWNLVNLAGEEDIATPEDCRISVVQYES